MMAWETDTDSPFADEKILEQIASARKDSPEFAAHTLDNDLLAACLVTTAFCRSVVTVMEQGAELPGVRERLRDDLEAYASTHPGVRVWTDENGTPGLGLD